ncbi:MAG: DegT/DnrJ/EryC1/StrS family aminotransferase [Reyranella sp.]|uniref:DegT/DnrJ/EryC1/StrS family aminotransferase n=1 Tax=Reyranella sp. TaxID=1929291 RepID=UPI001AD07B3C|nr:DegT/DnrJ/EryC1/StrS family aminotransferase [Reyranella sp.]MBN9087484.1 DegT/DnrJ/EryC1/StrS family aminotransferase [Reyranella sp.]
MSLTMPAVPAGGDDWALAGDEDLVCDASDSPMAAIEKCLDNGVGACLVVDGPRYLGRVTLGELGHTALDGALLAPTLRQHLDTFGRRLANDPASTEGLQPELDAGGNLIGVAIDRSAQRIQIARPDMSHLEFRALLDAFLSSWISSKGPYVERFETDFSGFVGVRHGIAVSNGTVALHLALMALGIGPGDEVIVPDLTFAATINAVLYCGATPVIADVDAHTWCLSLATVERACTPRTKAIIPVHLYGRPAEMGPIAAFAARHGIAIVEDCAEAHGARYAGRPVGGFGDVACFSFFANKIVTSGEGGMCLTNSADLAGTMRVLRDHGMTPGRSYWHERVGFNYRITNLQAAVGHAQLGRVRQTLRRNADIVEMYRVALGGIPGVRFPPDMDAIYSPVVWLASVLVPAERRVALFEAAARADIELRPFFHSLSTLPPYQPWARPCPVSLALSASGVNLPTSRLVDADAVDRVAEVFRNVLA